MIPLLLVLLALLPAATAPVAAQDTRTAAETPDLLIALDTGLGRILLELDSAAAPVTASNFLRYVDSGLFDGGTFHRTVRMDNQPDDPVKIEVIQGGMNRARRRERFPPIRLEGTDETGLRHLDGTLSMARSGPDTGRAEFFICVGPQPELDAGGARNPDGLGFAAFGRVVRGMDVVRAIQAGEADGQTLVEPVAILGARRVPPGQVPPGAP